MEKKGYISETMNTGRIVSHGKITNLSEGFRLPHGELFTIYLRPKEDSNDIVIDTIVPVRCMQDAAPSDCPVEVNAWSALAIAEIAPNADLLTTYDIYWGSGEYVRTEEE